MPTDREWADLRASDAERDRVAVVLRGALAEGRLTITEFEGRLSSLYELSTRRDLAGLISDVTSESLDLVVGRDATVAPAQTRGSRLVLSILGGASRRGHWQVSERCTVLNVMGGAHLDFTEAEIPPHGTRLRVWSLMGGSDIRVPEGWRVVISNFAVLGGNDIRLDPQGGLPSGAPEIRIGLISIMGGTKVRQGGRSRRRLTR